MLVAQLPFLPPRGLAFLAGPGAFLFPRGTEKFLSRSPVPTISLTSSLCFSFLSPFFHLTHTHQVLQVGSAEGFLHHTCGLMSCLSPAATHVRLSRAAVCAGVYPSLLSGFERVSFNLERGRPLRADLRQREGTGPCNQPSGHPDSIINVCHGRQHFKDLFIICS